MTEDAPEPGRDYRRTVFLPETPFPMRAGLPQKEPAILQAWAEADLYRSLRAERRAAGAPLPVTRRAMCAVRPQSLRISLPA